MTDQAARLAGLDFSEADREEMVAAINANLATFIERQTTPIDQSVALPLHFSPVVAGQTLADQRRPFVLAEQPSVTRPENLEDVAFWPVTRLGPLLAARAVRSVELTQMYLQRLKRLDPVLHCVVTFTEDLAFEQARRADAEIAAGRYRGPLHGIPWGLKDLFATRGYRTTWGFEAYREQVIDGDATVVERLDAAGAVLIAKLATGELARGDRWFGGRTRNPWKTDEGSGGSSAGPAAATAAGLVGFSLGTDTLESIVLPSLTCGLTGLRPTFGRVSRHGAMPVCWSLDTVGPLCRSVEDCAIVLDAIYGPDDRDLAVADVPFNWDGHRNADGLRVGYLIDAFDRPVNAQERSTQRNDTAALDVLRRLGIELRPFRLPDGADLDPLQVLLVDEAAAFDELMQSGKVDLLIQDRDEPEDMLMRVARLYPAVEYVQTHRRRALLMQAMAAAFRDFDVVVAPHAGSPIKSAAILTGRPLANVPAGWDDTGKPTGLLFVGKPYGEAELLTLAKAFQDATDFHRQHPDI